MTGRPQTAWLRFRPLIAWRSDVTGLRDARRLVESLTVEGLPHDQIPQGMRTVVAAFRHQTTTRRLAICTTFLREVTTRPNQIIDLVHRRDELLRELVEIDATLASLGTMKPPAPREQK